MLPDPNSAAFRAATSTRSRLKAACLATGTETRFLERRFCLERFLHRLVSSSRAGGFTLKGSLLLVDLQGNTGRPTMDMDAHLDDSLTPAAAAAFVRDVCSAGDASEDGLEFLPDPVRVDLIIEGHVPGLRLSFAARWANAANPRETMPMLVDLAWGDSPLPPVTRILPAVLPKHFPGVAVPSYPWEQVLAEKIHALARHGFSTTRMKDFYDLLVIARRAPLDASMATEALVATFRNWGTPALDEPLEVFEPQFPAIAQGHWSRFRMAKNGIPGAPDTLAEVVAEIRPLVIPLVEAAVTGSQPPGVWDASFGWEFTVAVPSPH